MSLTPEQIKAYREKYNIQAVQTPASISPEQIEQLRAKYGVQPQGPAPLQPLPEPQNAPVSNAPKQMIPTLQAVGNQPVRNTLRTFANIPSSALKLADEVTSPINPFRTDSMLNIGGNIVKGYEAGKDLIQQKGVVGSVGAFGGGLVDTMKKGVGIIGGVAQAGKEQIQKRGLGGALVEGVSRVAETAIEDPLLIPSLIYAPSKIRGTGITQDTITGTSNLVTKPLGKAKDVVSKAFEPTTKNLESTVIKQFQKGVKPRINMNMTPTQSTKFEGSIVDAVKVIDNNKPNLRFVDDLGEEFVGRNPKTLQELSEALEQTKKKIFTDYDSLAQQAGNQGLKIKTNNIAKELDEVIGNEALQISNPQAVKYAEELKDRLSFREIDAKTTQDVIQNYNESLKAFYRNPSYDSASKASIDAMVVNKLREALDEGVTSLTGQQYQAIKNQYASLKAVEKDIVKATLRDARKNNKSLLDYTDILTGGDLVTGLITLNPAQLARGSVSRGIKEFYKYLNSPNRAVNKMFQSAEKLNQRSIPKSQAIPSPSASVTPSGTTRLSTQPNANIPATPNINAIKPTITPKSNKASTVIPKNPNKAIEAFNKSEVIVSGNKFDLGTFGLNAMLRKVDKKDRLPIEDLSEAVANIKKAYKADKNTSSYRADNIVFISKMKNGDDVAIYTRQNSKGKEEIINWHKISDKKYLNDLAKNGAPDQNRTDILSLERSGSNPLTYGGNKTITPKSNKTSTVIPK